MAPLSPKRRKLAHEPVSARDDDDDDVNDSPNMSKTLPEKKQSNPKLLSIQDADQSALYAAGQYKSSIFKLQVDEMLAELQPNYTKRMPEINQALHSVHGLVETIEDREALPVWISWSLRLAKCLIL